MSVKRLFDVLVSLIGIILTAPLMVVIAIIIKMESRGPICYLCPRVGQHGQLFKMLKFRTMVQSADKIDCKLCGEADVRVTPFGKLLRRTKLNELPQLFNVLWGDMCLVGPRPEDPKFVAFHSDKWSIVLSVKPGIVGPNQILHRNEEDLFSPDCDRERFYVESILPEKLENDIAFVQNQSLFADLGILVRGAYVTLFRGGLRSRFALGKGHYLELVTDLGLSISAYLLANIIRFETVHLPQDLIVNMGLILSINACIFSFSGFYKRSTRFFSVRDLPFLVKLGTVAGVLFIVANKLILSDSYHSRVVLCMYPILLFGALAGVRVVHRVYLETREQKDVEEKPKLNTLIYGAGRLGVETLRRVQFDGDSNVLGFVDDNASLKNRSISGFGVLGTGHDLAFLKQLHSVERVVIALKIGTNEHAETARRRCIDAGISDIIIATAAAEESRAPAFIQSNRRKVRFSDQLGMKQVLLKPTDELAPGSVAAIIGGGDDLGEHLCREVARLGAEKVFVIDNCTARLSRIKDQLCHCPSRTTEFITLYQPWGFHSHLLEILRNYRVNWIFCNHLSRPGVASSFNGSAFILTNLIETVRLINLASNLRSKGFTLISPVLADNFSAEEKSVQLLCERYLTSAGRRKSNGTRYGVVRIPNVLEDQNGIFKRTTRNLALGNPVPISRIPMRFSSARYTARSILNSLPLHNLGETYIQSCGLTLSLATLTDMDARKEIQDVNECRAKRPDIEMTSVRPVAETDGISQIAMTPVRHLRVITKLELPDEVSYQRAIAHFAPYLNTHEETEISDFVSECSTKTSGLHQENSQRSFEFLSAHF